MKLTERQEAARDLLGGDATHVMLFGGSRSGKTFILVRQIIARALKAPGSRHAILRFRFNHVKLSIVSDTFPKVMALCYPQVKYHMDKTDWFAEFPNGSLIWFGGLDDKERTEKILGQEYATVFLNECSQIPLASRNIALTRLAQQVLQRIDGAYREALKPRMYYDCNPPPKNHWCYRMFVAKEDYETGRPLHEPYEYTAMQMNPGDNIENLAPSYLATLQSLPARYRKRFLEGEFGEANPNALWTEAIIERWRVMSAEIAPMQRIAVGVDPSGSGDVDNQDNDEIGIVVCGVGQDGIGYVLEDVSLKAGPARWGAVVASAFERHAADVVAAEVNFGGAMVEHVIKTARAERTNPRGTGLIDLRMPFKSVTASRGKTVRAEPISALFETGKVRMVGEFRELEQELVSFSTNGYLGEGSPNRADAMVWALYELFPGLIRRDPKKLQQPAYSLT